MSIFTFIQQIVQEKEKGGKAKEMKKRKGERVTEGRKREKGKKRREGVCVLLQPSYCQSKRHDNES